MGRGEDRVVERLGIQALKKVGCKHSDINKGKEARLEREKERERATLTLQNLDFHGEMIIQRE